MEGVEKLSLSLPQLPEDMKQWLLKTEAILLPLCGAGKELTDQELQAMKKCYRLRKKYNFTDAPDLPEVYLKPDKENLKTWEQIPGVIRTGLTVKQVAEIQRLADKKSNWEDRLDDE